MLSSFQPTWMEYWCFTINILRPFLGCFVGLHFPFGLCRAVLFLLFLCCLWVSFTGLSCSFLGCFQTSFAGLRSIFNGSLSCLSSFLKLVFFVWSLLLVLSGSWLTIHNRIQVGFLFRSLVFAFCGPILATDNYIRPFAWWRIIPDLRIRLFL